MKVLLRRNIAKLGQIGDVLEVKDGYARNYLIPQGLAMAPTRANLKAIEEDKAAYLAELARLKQELQTQANLLDGKEFTIVALANEEGVLYGSVGKAQIAAAIVEQGVMIDTRNILLDEPIHKLDKYEVTVGFGEDVTATIGLWVVPPKDEEAQGAGDDNVADDTSEAVEASEADEQATEDEASQQ